MNGAAETTPLEGSYTRTDPTPPDRQGNLVDYLAGLASAAKDAGHEGVRRGDPDQFDRAVTAIRAAADEFASFSADDVMLPDRGNELGAAFAHLRQLGEIEVCGYQPSRRPKRAGGLNRVWRRS